MRVWSIEERSDSFLFKYNFSLLFYYCSFLAPNNPQAIIIIMVQDVLSVVLEECGKDIFQSVCDAQDNFL